MSNRKTIYYEEKGIKNLTSEEGVEEAWQEATPRTKRKELYAEKVYNNKTTRKDLEKYKPKEKNKYQENIGYKVINNEDCTIRKDKAIKRKNLVRIRNIAENGLEKTRLISEAYEENETRDTTMEKVEKM